MGDKVLTDGDMVLFMPMFSPAIVVVQPGRLPGRGPASISSGARPSARSTWAGVWRWRLKCHRFG